MRKMIRCRHCEKLVPANPRIKNQEYCGKKECQKVRKAKRQKQKMANDSEYKASQDEAKKKWRLENPDYSKKYREKNPDYCSRNRKLQKKRDQKRREKIANMNSSSCDVAKMDASIDENIVNTSSYAVSDSNLAKMDALNSINAIKPGVYCISTENPDLAKMDASIQKVLIIPECYVDLAKMNKIDIHQIEQYFVRVQNRQNMNRKQEVNDNEDRKETGGPG